MWTINSSLCVFLVSNTLVHISTLQTIRWPLTPLLSYVAYKQWFHSSVPLSLLSESSGMEVKNSMQNINIMLILTSCFCLHI